VTIVASLAVWCAGSWILDSCRKRSAMDWSSIHQWWDWSVILV